MGFGRRYFSKEAAVAKMQGVRTKAAKCRACGFRYRQTGCAGCCRACFLYEQLPAHMRAAIESEKLPPLKPARDPREIVVDGVTFEVVFDGTKNA